MVLTFPARIQWCESTPPSGRTFSARVGEEVAIDLCVEKGKGVAAPVDVRTRPETVPGELPYNPTMRVVRRCRLTSG